MNIHQNMTCERSGSVADLLAKWAETVRTYRDHPGCGDDPEWCLLHEASHEALRQLMAVPATTIEDLAIKSYVATRYGLGESGPNGLGIDFEGGMMVDDGVHQSVVADALRLSPVLRATVSHIAGVS